MHTRTHTETHKVPIKMLSLFTYQLELLDSICKM